MEFFEFLLSPCALSSVYIISLWLDGGGPALGGGGWEGGQEGLLIKPLCWQVALLLFKPYSKLGTFALIIVSHSLFKLEIKEEYINFIYCLLYFYSLFLLRHFIGIRLLNSGLVVAAKRKVQQFRVD